MGLELYRYGEIENYHAPGSAAAHGARRWHGPETCREPARWSFVWLRSPRNRTTAREAACDRGLEDAILGGYVVGQSTPRRPVRGDSARKEEN
jgi:hypothetical protein